jgi:hypothetical protein
MERLDVVMFMLRAVFKVVLLVALYLQGDQWINQVGVDYVLQHQQVLQIGANIGFFCVLGGWFIADVLIGCWRFSGSVLQRYRNGTRTQEK